MFSSSNTYKDSKICSYNNRNDLLVIIFLFFVILCSFILNVRDDYTYLQFPDFDFKIPGSCLFKNATGLNCPSCGMTRSFVSISHFDFEGALRYNMAGILVYVWCLMEIIYRTLRVLTKNYSILLKPLRYLTNIVIAIAIVVAAVNWEIFK
ncbi:hypothetical protein JCM21531_648 [Acetivibrio straminisolvens JCM 21531]|jgi:hypothetical protein|uniref:DUF2752 domain-containing protein n=2 Tax=Acetivibrio straminisolvens TaxID=253314 RepID=W4V382_9FIRM|nr:hypothetical protein JCM21531_648 [Acetivibrio straminisolvens JCM 21531]